MKPRVRGGRGGIAGLAELQDCFARSPNGDMQFVSLTHAAHCWISG